MAGTPNSPQRRRALWKITVTAIVGVVLLGHTSQAIKDRFEIGGDGTILPARIHAARQHYADGKEHDNREQAGGRKHET